jgi:thioredoxin 1
VHEAVHTLGGDLVSVTMVLTLAVSPFAQRKKVMASDLIKHVSDASFEADVLKSDKPVLVDYWAEWCGPCKMIAPILDEVSTSYRDKLQIAKMNVDENRDIPAKFGIRGIPTLMLFKDGQLAATKVGAMSKAQLTAFIEQQLA